MRRYRRKRKQVGAAAAVDLTGLSYHELRQLAKEAGINSFGMKKETLILALS